MNQREFDEFMAGYYRHPAPGRAGEAIGYVATASWLEDSAARAPAVHFFRRLAELHPEVAAQYRAMRAAVRDAGDGFVDEVLRGVERSPLADPIRTPADITLHWAEFWVTGDSEPVRRIIELLDRPDRVRARLREWIAEPSSGRAAASRRRALQRLLRFGIACDSDGRRVLMEDEDLDCFVMLNGLQPTEERLQLAERALPVSLSPEDRKSALLKATAVATLAGNASQHPPVLAVCREQAQRASGPARRMLVRVLVAAGAPLTEAERRALASETSEGRALATSEPDGPSLLTRALLALALTLGFYTLAVGVAVALIAIAAAALYYGRAIGGKIAVIFLAAGGVILWAIIPRPDRFQPPGPRLDEVDHPRLFAELVGIARTVGQPMPAEVYLDHDVNAWVAERGGMLGVGRRRVMGLGLPLLEALTISEFRAVLAHEFGHYHGGDTQLGPWVYKTRLAIVRTLLALEAQNQFLQSLFVWYARLFIRVTHAVSRAQELAADRLAAHTAGREALVGGLRGVHASSAAFGAFLSTELLPALDAGFRPSLIEGFRRFLAAPGVASSMSQFADTQIVVGPASVYDSHPPLRERIAAVQTAPSADAPPDDRVAASLLDRLGDLEIDVLVSALGDEKLRTLPEIEWDVVFEKVWIPMWRTRLREHATALAGVTADSLPEMLVEPEVLGQALARDTSIPPDQARTVVVSIFGAGMALALHDQGWKLQSGVGAVVRAEHGDLALEPFSVVAALTSRELSATSWRERCAELGISSLVLGNGPATS